MTKHKAKKRLRKNLDSDARRLLVELLGRTDALFLPLRDPGAGHWPHVWVARSDYRQSGLPWASGASDDQEAQQAARALRRLHRVGLVRLVRSRGVAARTSHVRLTADGDEAAGRLMAWPRQHEAAVFVSVLRHYAPADEWVPEIALSDDHAGWGDGRQAALQIVEGTAFAALARGWATANCDAHGHVAYRVTPLAPPDIPDEPALPPADAALMQLYSDSFSSALAAWRSKREYSPDIGEIPLATDVMAWPRR